MGKVDVIGSVFESARLIRAHYNEVAVPLLVLILISGAGSMGGSGFSRNMGSGGAGALTGSSLFADSMLGNGTLALGGLLVVMIALFVIAVIALCIVSEATHLYVFEHFYSILNKKKIKENWTARFGRLAIKGVAIQALWLVIVVAAFILPALQFWNAVSALQSITAAGLIGAFASILLLLAAGLLLLLVAGFVLSPLWVYYAMDNRGIVDSIGRSITLVMGNLGAFLMLWFIFALLGVGVGGVAIVTSLCCVGWLVTPIASVFMSLLYGVALMKVKLAIEKK